MTMAKIKHELPFSMLIDNCNGEKYDPESNKPTHPVTTIFRKYHNKEDDVHKDIVFYSNGDVEFMDNVSMYRYTQFDHLLYNFCGDGSDIVMLHYLSFLSMVTQYGIPANTSATIKYLQYVEEMKRAKFDDIHFEESEDDSRNSRYHIECRGILTRSSTNIKGRFNCKDIFEDKPVALLCIYHKDGGIFGKKRKIYVYIFRDGGVVFHGTGPFRLRSDEFAFLLDLVFKICDITYDNMEEDFEDLDELYSEAIKKACRSYRDRNR